MTVVLLLLAALFPAKQAHADINKDPQFWLEHKRAEFVRKNAQWPEISTFVQQNRGALVSFEERNLYAEFLHLLPFKRRSPLEVYQFLLEEAAALSSMMRLMSHEKEGKLFSQVQIGFVTLIQSATRFLEPSDSIGFLTEVRSSQIPDLPHADALEIILIESRVRAAEMYACLAAFNWRNGQNLAALVRGSNLHPAHLRR